MGRLVGDHRGQPRLIPGIFQQAGEDAHLAPGEAEGVGVLIVDQDDKFPAVIRAVGRGGDPAPHPKHQVVDGRVPAGGILAPQGLKGLRARGDFAGLGPHEQLTPAGVGRGGAGGHQEGEAESQTQD